MNAGKWLLAIAVAALCVSMPASAVPPRHAFVLVHGAWMGRSAWDPVAARLRKQGEEVIQIELPAHGDDPTPADKVSLQSYVDAVVSAVGERKDVVLVGHSFGGVIISGVAEQVPERIGRLVYVAAYLPRNGESAYSLSQQDKDSHVPKFWSQADPAKYSPVTIRKDGLIDVFCNDCSPEAQGYVLAHHREEPVPPMGTPVKLTPERFGSVPRFYLATSEDHAVGYGLQRQMLTATPVKQVITLKSGHLPMLTHPAEVAAALRRFATE